MGHSNSSLNCFANCMKKYELTYIKHEEPDKGPSPHLTFGVMAHEVLYKAGKLRDEVADGVVTPGEYQQVIPSEVLYPELKEYFDIKSWNRYFTDVIKQVAEYERKICNEVKGPLVERELKLQLSVEELRAMGVYKVDEPFTGIIDLLVISAMDNSAIILDYKFSTNKKTQSDFDMNSQLFLYTLFVNKRYGIPVRNIQVGYIDIPKKEFSTPVVLTNGTLSRSKSQNVSPEMYKKAVLAIHGDDAKYNCDPGGYYYDCYMELQNNKAAYLQVQYVDEDIYMNVLNDLYQSAQMIDFMRRNKMPFLRKYDSYSCASCDYLGSCKPWLKVQWE